MAVTPVGNPYVESSDLVANYPGASEALAERIDIVGVNPFADAAARDAAIPSPVQGQMCSLNDDNKGYRYDGAAWQAVGGGKILQVVSVTKDDTFSSSSSSFVDVTGLSVSITPSSASSQVLVLLNLNTGISSATSVLFINLNRDSTAISQPSSGTDPATTITYGNGSTNAQVPAGVNYLDSPATTSAVTYKIQAKSTTSTWYFNRSHSFPTSRFTTSTITVMEVSA